MVLDHESEEMSVDETKRPGPEWIVKDVPMFVKRLIRSKGIGCCFARRRGG
jgi:hypothetical protein